MLTVAKVINFVYIWVHVVYNICELLWISCCYINLYYIYLTLDDSFCKAFVSSLHIVWLVTYTPTQNMYKLKFGESKSTLSPKVTIFFPFLLSEWEFVTLFLNFNPNITLAHVWGTVFVSFQKYIGSKTYIRVTSSKVYIFASSNKLLTVIQTRL